MSSPSKIDKNNLLSVEEIQYKPLNFDRYQDLENELTNEMIIQFLANRAGQFKERLNEKVWSLDTIINR